MKLLGRILIIALAIGLVVGSLVAVVPSSSAAGFEGGRPERQLSVDPAQAAGSTDSPTGTTARPEFAGRGERGGHGGEGGFGHIIRNAGIMAIIIALVALGMRWLRRRRDIVWL